MTWNFLDVPKLFYHQLDLFVYDSVVNCVFTSCRNHRTINKISGKRYIYCYCDNFELRFAVHIQCSVKALLTTLSPA